jgi:outer membrane murein-binding lipoprotein Lpp
MWRVWRLSVVAIVLTFAPVPARADCPAPIRSPGDSLTSVTEKLTDTVQCLNERVQLLERQLEAERMRSTASEAIARDAKARLDALDQDRARAAAPPSGNGR